jgi:hypothetical protein
MKETSLLFLFFIFIQEHSQLFNEQVLCMCLLIEGNGSCCRGKHQVLSIPSRYITCTKALHVGDRELPPDLSTSRRTDSNELVAYLRFRKMVADLHPDV